MYPIFREKLESPFGFTPANRLDSAVENPEFLCHVAALYCVTHQAASRKERPAVSLISGSQAANTRRDGDDASQAHMRPSTAFVWHVAGDVLCDIKRQMMRREQWLITHGY